MQGEVGERRIGHVGHVAHVLQLVKLAGVIRAVVLFLVVFVVEDGAERLPVAGGEHVGERLAIGQHRFEGYVGLGFLAQCEAGLVERRDEQFCQLTAGDRHVALDEAVELLGEFFGHFLVGCHDVPFLMSRFHAHSHSAPMVAAPRSMTNAAGDGMRMRRG